MISSRTRMHPSIVQAAQTTHLVTGLMLLAQHSHDASDSETERLVPSCARVRVESCLLVV
jgi:hypothetical protein